MKTFLLSTTLLVAGGVLYGVEPRPSEQALARCGNPKTRSLAVSVFYVARLHPRPNIAIVYAHRRQQRAAMKGIVSAPWRRRGAIAVKLNSNHWLGAQLCPGLLQPDVHKPEACS